MMYVLDVLSILVGGQKAATTLQRDTHSLHMDGRMGVGLRR
jgi:hypothetical protein